MKAIKLLTFLALFLLVPSVLAAECELFERFDYTYTNNDDVTHRVTFVLLNKTSEDMRVIFEPSVLIVIPGQTANFSATAQSDEPLEGIQSAGFAIRRGTEVVGQTVAYFDLSCPDEIRDEPAGRALWRDVLFYVSILLIVAILIIVLVVRLLDRTGPGPRKENRTAPPQTSSTREPRAPINVDAMIRAERERSASAPWWVWVLAALIAVLVIGGLIYLAVSGANVEGFNYGAGINITNRNG